MAWLSMYVLHGMVVPPLQILQLQACFRYSAMQSPCNLNLVKDN